MLAFCSIFQFPGWNASQNLRICRRLDQFSELERKRRPALPRLSVEFRSQLLPSKDLPNRKRIESPSAHRVLVRLFSVLRESGSSFALSNPYCPKLLRQGFSHLSRRSSNPKHVHVPKRQSSERSPIPAA